MILFNRSCDNPGYAYAVASHQHGLLAAILIKHLCAHAGAVFVAQLEYMADFDAAGYRYFAATRACITFNYIT